MYAYPDKMDQQLVFALIQMVWDRAEADGYALHMTTDPLPDTPTHQVMEQVAYSDDDPLTAVVASNDYVDGGLFIGTTHDGGNTWRSWFEASRYPDTGDFCSGGDPSVVYSDRDHAFYASQLCFFRSLPYSAQNMSRKWRSSSGMSSLRSRSGGTWSGTTLRRK